MARDLSDRRGQRPISGSEVVHLLHLDRVTEEGHASLVCVNSEVVGMLLAQNPFLRMILTTFLF